jgi:hypothetical protein
MAMTELHRNRLPAVDVPIQEHVPEWEYVDRLADTRADELLVKHAKRVLLTASCGCRSGETIHPLDAIHAQLERLRDSKEFLRTLESSRKAEVLRLRQERIMRASAPQPGGIEQWGSFTVYTPGSTAEAEAFYEGLRVAAERRRQNETA